MRILYRDKSCIVPQKPCGVLSEGEGDNSIITLLQKEEGITAYPVHRLDKPVGGAMLLATDSKAVEKLKAEFCKEYIFVVWGMPEKQSDTLKDLMFYDRKRSKSFVVNRLRSGVKEASLEYTVISHKSGLSLIKAKLHTGRTHQIRVQFSSRKMPLYGDRRYGGQGSETIALWSHKLTFNSNGKNQTVLSSPDINLYPWSLFAEEIQAL